MIAKLQDVINERAWSMSGLIYAVADIHDVEGRPLGERRAASAAKTDVPMVLRDCPYHDERKGIAMNVSALSQITRYLDEVLEDVGQFRAQLPDGDLWDSMLATIIDQLTAPVSYLLRRHPIPDTIPAKHAVAHKLAAGFFGVLRKILIHDAQKKLPPASYDVFIKFVHDQRLLIGQSEACAGPPPMIEKASRAVAIRADAATAAPPWRHDVARILTDQIRLGIAWELFDRITEQRFLLEGDRHQRLDTKTGVIARALAARIELLLESETIPSDAALNALPLALDASKAIAEHLRGAPRADDPLLGVLIPLVGDRHCAIRLSEEDITVAAQRFARYIRVYHAFAHTLAALEVALRDALSLETAAPIKLSGMIMPHPRTLRWFEAAFGHKLIDDVSVDAPPSLWRPGQRHVLSL